MQHKFNARRRRKFPAAKYRLKNWPEYNEALRLRGDLAVWLSEDAVTKWLAPRRKDRDGQAKYSDFALWEALSGCFPLGLRQFEDLLNVCPDLSPKFPPA